MPAARMHADELEIDGQLVRRLLETQFPSWAGLPLEGLPAGGTDNAIFRLGDSLSVRLPRRAGWSPGSLDKEFEWLPHLAPRVPLSLPAPVARGVPGEGYPHAWSVFDWLPGEDASSVELDLHHAALDLAGFVHAMGLIDPAGGPSAGGRGGPLAPRDEDTRDAIAALGEAIDTSAVTRLWDESLAAPEWDSPPVWLHGDLDRRNLLVQNGRIAGVLDWACCGVGDPACDVKVAWTVLDAETRKVFRRLVEVDDATWLRARGWAVSQAVIAIPYYAETYPVLAREARRWLAEALRDL